MFKTFVSSFSGQASYILFKVVFGLSGFYSSSLPCACV